MVFPGQGTGGVGHLRVDIDFVDHEEGGDGEVAREIQDAAEVVHAGYGRLGDDQCQVGTGDRSYRRATGAGRSVAENAGGSCAAGGLAGSVAYLGYQFAAVFFADAEAGVDHGAAVSFGEIPFAGATCFHGDRLYRADERTEAAAFTGFVVNAVCGINGVVRRAVVGYGVEMAGGGANAA